MPLGRRRTRLPESIIIRHRWRRTLVTALGCVVLLVLIVCDRVRQEPTKGNDYSRYHDKSFRVARVVDGDTLDIDAPDGKKQVTRIRLWGVDTPELSRNGMADMHFGREAAAFARDTLEGKNVHVVLSPKKTRGKYGRLLAYVFMKRGGRMFNEMLLEEGLAYADLRFEHHYFEVFKAIEKRTRASATGLWSGIKLENMPAWKQRFERKETTTGG